MEDDTWMEDEDELMAVREGEKGMEEEDGNGDCRMEDAKREGWCGRIGVRTGRVVIEVGGPVAAVVRSL
jgi:hypothetical protein